MPVPETKFRNPDTLHKWFAISSILMTASILWMIKVDYERPWRDIQDDYYLAKATMAHLDYLDAVRQENINDIEDAKQRLADAEEFFNSTAVAQRDELQIKQEEADLNFRKADGPWSRADQVLEVTKDTYERSQEINGAEHPKTLAAHTQFLDEEEQVDQLRKEKEHWEDLKNELAKQIRELQEPVDSADKLLREMQKIAQDAKDKDNQFSGVLPESSLFSSVFGSYPVVEKVINLSLLDFIAPKNTPSRHQVNQLVLYDVRQRLNYLETYTTDRCTTCHVAIDDPEFSKEQLAKKLEKSLPAINEALQRIGQLPFDIPPPPVLDHEYNATLTQGRVTDHWDKLSKQQQDEYFDVLLAFVNQYMKKTDRKNIELGQPLLAHPDLDLFVTVDSAHPMAKIGCTVCHEGNPQETDFVLAAHSPSTHKIEEEWKDKYYVRHLGLPVTTFEVVEHYWDRPMRLPAYTESGCAKCHSEIEDIARFNGERKGSRINLGKHLFVNVGCVNCHDVDTLPGKRRVGPELTYVASKLQKEFVEQWIYFPQKYRPSTRMPHFFMQENNRDESANSFDPHPELRTETEVAAIAKYLFAVSKAWSPIPKPADITGDAQRGRQLFRQLGCVACHANTAEFGEEWITRDIMHREKIDEDKALHRYKGMTNEQRVRYSMEHFNNERDTFLHPDKTKFNPDDDYNLPTFSRFAPELSGIGSKATFEWLYSWVIDPTHYSPDTKMPKLRLTPPEAADLATYLMTLQNDEFVQKSFEINEERSQMVDDLIFGLLSAQRSERRSLSILNDDGGELTNMMVTLLERSIGHQSAIDLVSPMTLENKKLMYLGNKTISHYGCYACHKISGFETTTPPGTDLSGWAEKPVTQLDFAFYDHAFHHMREEKEEVFGYVYPRDSHELNYWSPLSDDMREQITHTHGAFAKHKMLNPRIWDRNKLKRPYDKLKMPNFYFSEEEAEALTTYLLSRIPPRVSESLKVDYEQSTLGPIARGRSLTRELNCVACHQIEENVPTIQQYFRRDINGELTFDVTNAPPILRGEGAKVQHNWLHRFLQHVEPLRPWLAVRMPSFNLTGEEATTLVEYFAALSRDDSIKLEATLAPVDEYITKEKEKSKSSDQEDSSGVGGDWYTKSKLEDSVRMLQRFGVERSLVRSNDINALVSSGDRLRDAHARLYKQSTFLKELYDVEYPFVEPPAALEPAELFDRGMNFLNDMGCLKCHVLGDMLPGPAHTTDDFVQMYRLDGVRGEGENAVAILNNQPYPVGSKIDGHTLISATNIFYDSGDIETKAVVEGPSPSGEIERVVLQAASAPNLTLTYERLRRAWVFNWMLEPNVIQPGTKMPQNFAGGVSPFEGDPSYPGTGIDHINLLVDTLFDAGRRHVRSPLLKIIETPQEDFDEEGMDEGFDDEEEFDD